MAANNGLEVEVKFLLADGPAVRRRILETGAKLSKPRVYERNVRFDTPDEALLGRWELLRMRQDTAVTVTFKGPAVEDLTSEAKVREEIEVRVDDFDQMSQIFERLGYHPLQVYEKYRETFELAEVEIVLDELPYGTFLELEGREDAIRALARTLGLEWSQRILANYLGMMEMLVRQHNLPFRDLTFANFTDRDVSAWDIFPLISTQFTEEQLDNDEQAKE